jgi:hypothetical protein
MMINNSNNDQDQQVKEVSQTQTSGSKRRTKPCKFFKKGTCNRGDACAYLHMIDPATSTNTENNETDDFTDKRRLLTENGRPSLKLGAYVVQKTFKTLQLHSDYLLLNGTRNNSHPIEHIARQIAISKVVEKCHIEGWSIKDYQGKARGPLPWLDPHDRTTALTYPHCCREGITARDYTAGVTHPYEQCPLPPPDVLMMVDVAQKLTYERLAELVGTTNNRTAYLVMSIPSGVKLLGGRVFRPKVDGHFDRTPDLYKPEMVSGSTVVSVPKPDGTVAKKTLAWTEWGPEMETPSGLQVIVKMVLIDTELPPAVEELSMTIAEARMELPAFPVGMYKCTDGTLEITEAHYVSGNSVIDRVLYQFCLRQFSGRTISSRAVPALVTKIKAVGLEPDLRVVNLALDDYLSKVKLSTVQKVGAMVLGDRSMRSMVHNRNLSIVTALPRVTQIPVPSTKMVLGLVNSIPKLLQSLPVLLGLLAWYNHKRRASSSNGPKSWYHWALQKIHWMGVTKTVPFSGYNVLYNAILGLHPSTVGLYSRFSVGASAAWKMILAGTVFEEGVKQLAKSVANLALAGTPLGGAGKWAGLLFGLAEFTSRPVEALTHPRRLALSAAVVGIHTIGTLDLPKAWLIGASAHLTWNMLTWCTHPGYKEPVPYDEATQGPVDRNAGIEGYETESPLKALDKHATIRVYNTLSQKYIYQHDGREFGDYKVGWELSGTKPSYIHPATIVFDSRPSIANPSVQNLVVGIVNRCAFECPQALPNRWASSYRDMQVYLPNPVPEFNYLSFAEWTSSQDRAKRTQHYMLLDAAIDGMAPSSTLEPFTKKEYYHVGGDKHFIMPELSAQDKDPRVINGPADPLMKVVTGPPLKSAYKWVVRHWNGENNLSQNHHFKSIWMYTTDDVRSLSQKTTDVLQNAVEKLANTVARGWLVATNGDDNFVMVSCALGFLTLGCDGKRWDRTIRHEALRCENSVIRYLTAEYSGTLVGASTDPEFPEVNMNETYGDHDSFCKVLRSEAGLDHHVPSLRLSSRVGHHIVTAAIGSIRTSGSQRTSFGNNLCNTASCVSFADRIVADEFATMDQLREAWTQHWRDHGVIPEIFVTKEVSQAEFCSMRFCPIGNKHYAIPKIGKFLLRMGWSKSKPKPLSHIRGLMQQLQPYKNVPFIGPWIKQISNLVGVPELKGYLPPEYKYSVFVGQTTEIPPPTQETWDWFEQLYGVGETENCEFAAALSTVTALPWKLDGQMLHPFFKVDC